MARRLTKTRSSMGCRAGCLHLNDLHRGDAEAIDLTPRRSDAREALQYLQDVQCTDAPAAWREGG